MFDVNGFTAAAKAMGYSDDEINQVAAIKQAQSTSPGGQLESLTNKTKEAELRQQNYDLLNKQKAAQNPLQLSYDPNRSAIQQQQDALNQEYKNAGGLRTSDIKDFYSPYVKEEQSTNVQVNKEKRAKLDSANVLDQTLSSLDELKDLSRKYNVLDMAGTALGVSASGKIFDQKKALLGQQIAKLAEYGKLQGGRGISDKDREFYTNKIMNMGAIGLQGPIDEQIDALKRDVARSAGFDPDKIPGLSKKEDKPLPSTGSVVMTGPDGKKWNVPSDKVELFKKNGYK